MDHFMESKGVEAVEPADISADKPRSKKHKPDQNDSNLVLRPLELNDFDKGFTSILGQLTDVGNVTKQMFVSQFEKMQSLPGHYFIMVIEDSVAREGKGQIIAAASLILELKFIHSCGRVGHIEDVVVNESYRGKKLGIRVVEALIKIAQQQQCYKVILDCEAHNIPFYAKLGFVEKSKHMALYFNK